MLALAGVAFGAQGYLQASSAESRARALSRTVADLQRRVSVDEVRAGREQKRVRAVADQVGRVGRQSARVASQLADIPPQMQGLELRLAGYSACLPELQRELTGLVINWHMGPFKASPDYVTLADKARVSGACTNIRASG